MAHTLTLTLPNAVFEPLRREAERAGRTPEEVVLDWLTKEVSPRTEDPLLRLMVAFSSEVTDAGERHDHYIGQTLLKRMRGEADD